MKNEIEAGADEPHAVELTAWDVPSAIGAGERFRLAVGVRCSHGCDLGGKELSLYDQKGVQACTVELGREMLGAGDQRSAEALYTALLPAAGRAQERWASSYMRHPK